MRGVANGQNIYLYRTSRYIVFSKCQKNFRTPGICHCSCTFYLSLFHFQAEAFKIRAEIKGEASRSRQHPVRIIAEHTRNVHPRVAASIGNQTNLARMIHRTRVKGDLPPIPVSMDTFDIPDDYTVRLNFNFNFFLIIQRQNFCKKSQFLFFFKLFLHTFFAKKGLFATRPPFLNRPLLINGSFFRKVTFHMINVKRVVL